MNMKHMKPTEIYETDKSVVSYETGSEGYFSFI
jgi:hypothetical protein